MNESTQKRGDLVLAPGSYAYMQDTGKGTIKTYTGPTVLTPTAQEVPVIYDAKGDFRRVDLYDAIRRSPVAVEGYYIILLNPATGNKHPDDGAAQQSAELDVGRKVNIPGPAMFSLWPGQSAEVVRGHHLRSNQYLLVRVYNEEEARKNWTKAVVKPATDTQEKLAVTGSAPEDLTVGRMLIIRGTEVSFYIPPTGITVMADGQENGRTKYVRDALTLERLEYCILVEENGKKRYEKGPQVVFPLPTERFVDGRDDENRPSRKFRALELTEIQGLHVKVIAPYEETGKRYEVGEELFITGKDTAIYFPREEHSAIKYDGKAKHYATAIPAGEARYMMNRLTGAIATVPGPKMLLPDPRTEVIVRRVLSDRQCSLWYPGNVEALNHNKALRELLQGNPTARAGAISEGDVLRGQRAGQAKGVASTSGNLAERAGGDPQIGGEEFSRGTTYTQPRTVTLDTKYQGVPSLDIWTGYAVQVVSKTGKRRVVAGPATLLMEYDESLEVLELSTGKPKTTDKMLQTVYLRVENNKVTDHVSVETADHVMCRLVLSYRVNFEGDPAHWFKVENYVKFLCDHVRSILKGAIKKIRVEDFYANSTDMIREILLQKTEGGNRPGMVFSENGMRMVDVEVLNVDLTDERIRTLLHDAQHEVVKTNIDLSVSRRALEVLKQKEIMVREEAAARTETTQTQHRLAIEVAASELAVLLAKAANELQDVAGQQQLVEEREKVTLLGQRARLLREKEESDQHHSFAVRQQEQRILLLRAEAEAVVSRFTAAMPGFSEALLALSHNESMVKIAEAWNIQRALGGDSLSDAISKVFEGTSLGPIVAKISGARPNGTSPASHP